MCQSPLGCALAVLNCSLTDTGVLLQDEAFELWTIEWGSLYDKGSKSHKVIQSIADTWYLVSVVENDYINGDLFQVLLAA